jgi:hypothetical protein
VRAGAALGLLLLGGVVGLSATWTHSRWWALALGAASTLVLELAVPAGLLRIAYAVGWVALSAYFLLARPEGDFVVASDPIGYAFIGVGLVVLLLAVATISPRRRARPGFTAGTGRST